MLGVASTAFTTIITGSILRDFKATDKTYYNVAQVPTIITATAIIDNSAVIPTIFQEYHAISDNREETPKRHTFRMQSFSA